MRTEYILEMHLPEYDRPMRIQFNSRYEVLASWSGVCTVLTKTKGIMVTNIYHEDEANSLQSSKREEL